MNTTASLQLTNGPGGLSAGPFPVTLGTTLAVGATSPVTTALSQELPAGPWLATITLRSGTLISSAKGTITFPVSGSAMAVSTADPSGSSLTWVYLLAGAVALLVIVGFLLWWLLGRRRRRDHSAARSQPAHRRE